jgi:hypothetical protein
MPWASDWWLLQRKFYPHDTRLAKWRRLLESQRSNITMASMVNVSLRKVNEKTNESSDFSIGLKDESCR